MVNFDKEVNRYGTFCTQWDYCVDRFGHEDMLPFSISDMDFEMPNSTKEVLTKSIERGIFGYTRWRHDEFKNSISNWYQTRFDYEINKEHLSYSPTVIFSLAELLRMKSKNVLVLTPAYDAFFEIIKENNCQEFDSELIIENNQFVINKIDFEQKLKQVDTLLFCSPHNPVGKVFREEELTYVITQCKKHNVYIISDEIHMDVTFKKRHIPIMKITDQLNYTYNTAIITSATKSFNFPGLLFSYLLIGDLELKMKFENNLKNKNGLSSCTTLGLLATIDVYTNGQAWLDQLNNYIYENYLYVVNYIESNNLNLKIYQFDGTYLLWIDATGYQAQFNQLKDIMYNDLKVGIMDGNVYKKDNYLRINIGCSKKKLIEGISRLHQSINKLEEKCD